MLHDLWHVAVLGATLFGAVGALLLLLAPLLFDQIPPGVERQRPLIYGLLGAAAVLIVLEWTLIH